MMPERVPQPALRASVATSALHTAADYRRAAEGRLSGAGLPAKNCNPVDLSTPSFKRVSHFAEDDGPVQRVKMRLVVDDDDDADW